MRIAVLSPVAWRTPPEHYGPWEQVASNLTENLVKMGADVTLFATADSLTTAHLDAVIDQGYETLKGQDAKVLECLHIGHLMENAHRFDIIHNHFDFLPLTYSKLIKTPIITTIHGFSSSQIIPVYQKYNRNTHYVSISDADRSPELEYMATVYNGISPEDFEFNDQPEDYLLYFGRIHHDKGTAEAIDIALKSDKKLIIAGIVQDPDYFRERIEPFLDDQIEFIGHAGPQKRKKLMKNALALLHPINFDEPFGLSVAEAMFCGTPTIAFKRGSMPELILHEKTGYLVENVEEAAAIIRKGLAVDRENCHATASLRFSAERMAADYFNLYQQILK